MLAFIPVFVPICARLFPLLLGAGAGALTVAAVKGGNGNRRKIKALKERVVRLEQRESRQP